MARPNVATRERVRRRNAGRALARVEGQGHPAVAPDLDRIIHERMRLGIVSAPATSGGEKLSAKRRPGPENRETLAAPLLSFIAHSEIASATPASAIHTATQRPCSGWTAASAAAASALTPTPTIPHPGTAVNDPASSMVLRMNRRLSIAWSCRAGGSSRCGRLAVMERSLAARRGWHQVLCDVKVM